MALILNRVAVGMFIMFSGYHKLFDAGRHRVFADELRSLHVPAVGINQWLPLVEFSAGAAVVIVALGLLVIILIATVTLMAQPDLQMIISAMSRRLVAGPKNAVVCRLPTNRTPPRAGP